MKKGEKNPFSDSAHFEFKPTSLIPSRRRAALDVTSSSTGQGPPCSPCLGVPLVQCLPVENMDFLLPRSLLHEPGQQVSTGAQAAERPLPLL